MDVDDEDVDFVAGTPTCYSKRSVILSIEVTTRRVEESEHILT